MCTKFYLANIAEPLNALTRKGAPFNWTTACAEALDTLRIKLCQTPVLVYPTFTKGARPFIVLTDASAISIGAILEQDGQSAERNYSVIQGECLAVVYALKQFRHYLLGRHFRR